MKMSAEVKKTIAECGPAIIATASKSGRPNVSPKGSLRVVDDEHVVFADVRSPRTISNLEENPYISIICLKMPERKGCRIWGKAEIIDSGELFDQWSQEMAARNMKPNHIVKVAVDEFIVF
jgi:uncharacterized protein